jgi:hypothetical protein
MLDEKKPRQGRIGSHRKRDAAAAGEGHDRTFELIGAGIGKQLAPLKARVAELCKSNHARRHMETARTCKRPR